MKSAPKHEGSGHPEPSLLPPHPRRGLTPTATVDRRADFPLRSWRSVGAGALLLDVGFEPALEEIAVALHLPLERVAMGEHRVAKPSRG